MVFEKPNNTPINLDIRLESPIGEADMVVEQPGGGSSKGEVLVLQVVEGTGDSRAACNTAKRASNHAVHRARSEVERSGLRRLLSRRKKILGLQICIVLPSKSDVTTRMSRERNLSITIPTNCR